MSRSESFDFGAEVSKIMPRILREIIGRQMSVLSKGKLAVSHIVILDYLLEKGPTRMGELAEVLHLTMSAVTAIVDRMIELNLAKREHSRDDRRVIYISLLKNGKNTAISLNEERRKISNEIFSLLTEAEKHEYLRLLKKVTEGLKGRK